MLDMPASGEALWRIFDSTGLRPEYLLPVLMAESGLNPGVQNQAGANYWGIGQNSGDFLAALGIDVNDYLTWPASAQLGRVVLPYMKSVVQRFGALNSGTRVYQANFLPATLSTARSLSSVLTSSPSPFYTSNMGFDPNRKGYITLGDLSTAVARAASTSTVQRAIVQTYQLAQVSEPYALTVAGNFLEDRLKG